MLQSDGGYALQINDAVGARGFYRVNGLGGTNGGIVVTFTTPAFQVVEGNTVNTTLVLSQPRFTGEFITPWAVPPGREIIRR